MSEDEKAQRNAILDEKQKTADEENATRSGIGTRVRVGQTRGKNPMVITWEAFDESKPDTLPDSIQKFMETTSVKDEATLVSFLISGYNDNAYTTASDPIAEYLEPTWTPDVSANFRLVVRNYARGLNQSIEDAVALIKPGFVAQFGSAGK